MIYIFDTNIFIILNHFYPTTFKSLWQGLEILAATGEILSTREVYNELKPHSDKEFILKWARDHKSIFTIPNEQEMLFVQKIFSINHFRMLISKQAMLQGTPVADPFVIAAAGVRNGVVVTSEQLKPNAAKIPNVCQHFNIPYIDLEEFLKRQGWTF